MDQDSGTNNKKFNKIVTISVKSERVVVVYWSVFGSWILTKSELGKIRDYYSQCLGLENGIDQCYVHLYFQHW